MRALFEMSVSKAALEKDHPELVPIGYGRGKDEASKSLLQFTVDYSAALAPLDVTKVIRCGCATDQPSANDRIMCGRISGQ